MNYTQLLQFLQENRDEAYAEFSKTLSNSEYQVIGVRLPVMQKFIKAHYQDKDLHIEQFELGNSLEVDYIYWGIGLKRLNTIEEQLEFVKQNVKTIKAWNITDSIHTFLLKCPYELFRDCFYQMYNSDYLFERRFAYIFAMQYRKEERILEILDYIRENDKYMVMMGEAWFLATLAICFPEEVFNKVSTLKDDKLKKKTISKIVESYRISGEWKDRFKSLR